MITSVEMLIEYNVSLDDPFPVDAELAMRSMIRTDRRVHSPLLTWSAMCSSEISKLVELILAMLATHNSLYTCEGPDVMLPEPWLQKQLRAKGVSIAKNLLS